MKFLKLGLILTAFSLFIFACAQNSTNNSTTANNTTVNTTVGTNTNTNAQPAETPDELETARKIYMAQCVNCHKEDGSGGASVIEGKKIKAPDFRSDKLKKEPDAEFIEIIEKGEKSDGMPAFKGKISDEDIKNLVKYIRREFQGQ